MHNVVVDDDLVQLRKWAKFLSKITTSARRGSDWYFDPEHGASADLLDSCEVRLEIFS